MDIHTLLRLAKRLGVAAVIVGFVILLVFLVPGLNSPEGPSLPRLLPWMIMIGAGAGVAFLSEFLAAHFHED